jgi:hypothetical protein
MTWHTNLYIERHYWLLSITAYDAMYAAYSSWELRK